MQSLPIFSKQHPSWSALISKPLESDGKLVKMLENKIKKVTIKLKAIQTEVTAIFNNLNSAINQHAHQTEIF